MLPPAILCLSLPSTWKPGIILLDNSGHPGPRSGSGKINAANDSGLSGNVDGREGSCRVLSVALIGSLTGESKTARINTNRHLAMAKGRIRKTKGLGEKKAFDPWQWSSLVIYQIWKTLVIFSELQRDETAPIDQYVALRSSLDV